MKVRFFGFLAVFALCAWLGYWLAGTAVPAKPSESARSEATHGSRGLAPMNEPTPKLRSGERLPTAARDLEAVGAGALEGQRVITFADRGAMEKFIARLGGDLRLLGRLDSLLSLRVGFSDVSELAALLDGSEELSFIFPISTPPLPEGSVQPGAMALGSRLLEWLGVSGDNSSWGSGVLVAILDTGVTQHPAFQNAVRSINLVDLPADLRTINPHGTAVASLVAGSGGLTPGVAPGADILSVRVANDLGQSDSFLLAQGIMAAVNAGASPIIISMGGPGESAVLRKAIEYAHERGVMIFAAAGNKGIGQVAYPAASKGVIAVGAVDAHGRHLDFSNTGSEVDISAPGYGVNAAYSGAQAASVSGTSFSTPIVGGVVAAVMTEAGGRKLNSQQAWEMVSRHLNDGGAPGRDDQLGAGMPDISRVLNANTPGIYDAAVASQNLLPPDASNPYGQVEVVIQNRGTEPLVNTALHINNHGSRTTHNITTLAPNAVAAVRVPVTRPAVTGTAGFQVEARVSLTGSVVDARPGNDQRIETYAPAGSP